MPPKGSHPTKETITKMSAAHSGERNAFSGKHHTPEARAEMSATRKGKKKSPDHCRKIAAKLAGRKKSPESVAKMRATYRPDFYFPEYDLYWDIKGYWWHKAPDKVWNFFSQYPDKTLKILYKQDIIKLEEAVQHDDAIDITQVGTTKIYSPLK